MSTNNTMIIWIANVNKKHMVEAISVDGLNWGVIPEDKRDLELHNEVKDTAAVVGAVRQTVNDGQVRRVRVKVNPEIKAAYLDEADNFTFRDELLSELYYDMNKKPCTNEKEYDQIHYVRRPSENEIELVKRIKELEQRIRSDNEINLNDVEKRFVLKKFNGKGDPNEFILLFEKECIRHKLTDESKKIDVLRLFLEDNALDWYELSLRKLSRAKFDDWKSSLVNTYDKQSWSDVRYALTFMYRGGQLRDFILKKECLLLEMDKDISETLRVYLIVCALPIEVQDRIDRKKVKNVHELMIVINEMNDRYLKIKKNRYDYEIKKNRGELEVNDKIQVNVRSDRKPCFKCTELNFGTRYHRPEECFNSNLYDSKINKKKSSMSVQKEVNLMLSDKNESASLVKLSEDKDF